MRLTSIQKFHKPVKTISGVTPLAVTTKPRKCNHGTCTYCPSLKVPQSYTPKSPVVMRGKRLDYDPYRQVKDRLEAFHIMDHPSDKIELIVMGGTFLSYPKDYQHEFIKRCYDALNGVDSENLEEAKKANEKAKHRCIALCIETRPDVCNEEEIKRILEFGCTRVELGVQIIDDEIYKRTNRGHNVKDVIEATERLKNYGFKVGYHLMPGLPGSNPEKDIELFLKIFSDERFKPDQLKIYPCQVIKGSELEKEYEKGEFKPYSDEEITELLIKLKSIVPEYCRIMRIMREIPPLYLTSGTFKVDFRKIIEQEMKNRGLKCRCIRCREIGFALRRKEEINDDINLKILGYDASGGKEFFLQFVNKDDIIFGLCRLRIKEDKAFIRELHVFGKSLSLGKKPSEKKNDEYQHKGFGKRLVEEAEKIARLNKAKKIYVISGIGVRDYYRKLGYELEGNYMVKDI